VLFAITSVAEGVSVEESVHLPLIFTLLTRIPCTNYCLVNQALYLVGQYDVTLSLLLLLSALMSQMSSAIQCQHHQLTAVTAVHPPLSGQLPTVCETVWYFPQGTNICEIVWYFPQGTCRLLPVPSSSDRLQSGLGWSGSELL